MNFIKVILLIALLLSITPSSHAKKRCKGLLEKLHNVQVLQRNGYSVKRAASLRAKEDKARDKWWQCEQGRKTKKKKKSKTQRSKKNKHKQVNKVYSQKNLINKTANLPFKINNAIVVKSKYHGHKKQAWLKFYQQPNRCKRPKSLAIFASCSEDKQAQRIVFEQGFK